MTGNMHQRLATMMRTIDKWLGMARYEAEQIRMQESDRMHRSLQTMEKADRDMTTMMNLFMTILEWNNRLIQRTNDSVCAENAAAALRHTEAATFKEDLSEELHYHFRQATLQSLKVEARMTRLEEKIQALSAQTVRRETALAVFAQSVALSHE